MIRLLVAWICGTIFAFGLGISGMTLPRKVVAFLDITGEWDPSLAFVMGGAIGVHLLFHRLVLTRRAPLLARTYQLPTRTVIDLRLVGGSALFGLGWGLGGFCPGPGIVAAAGGGGSALTFVAAMIGGMLLFHLLDGRLARDPEPGETVAPSS